MSKIAIIGASGLVGVELHSLLKASPFAPKEIKLFGREENFNFRGFEFVFLCTPAKVALLLAPLAISHGAKVIDLSSAHRLVSHALLFHPFIKQNIHDHSLIAIPNCIVSIMLSILAPLHRRATIKRIYAATYQAASGAGKEGITELLEEKDPKIFPHPYKNNLFIHEKHIGEEEKIIDETRLLLQSPNLGMHIRSVRVPIVRAHSMALNVSFETKLEPDVAMELLEKQPGISFAESPTPKMAENKKDVFYGPVRLDTSLPNTLDLFVCGDQLLRGAALTALACYEEMISGGIRL